MMDAELHDAIAAAVEKRFRAIGPVFTQGAPTPPGVASTTVPGLVKIGSTDLAPVAVIGSEFVRKMKAADTTNAAVAGVSCGLSVAVKAGESWLLEYRLAVKTKAQAAGNGVQFGLARPAAATVIVGGVGRNNADTQLLNAAALNPVATGAVFLGGGSFFSDPGAGVATFLGVLLMTVQLVNVTADGAVDATFAPLTSPNHDTTILAGSTVVGCRIVPA